MTSAAVDRVREAPLSLARSVPVWAWLGGIVAVSAAVRFGIGRRIVAPWIMVDELIYSELARGIASGAGFVLRGEPVGMGYGAVYPLLLSPAFLVESLPHAYAVAKGLNALLVSLAAVPAYLLARRVVSQPLALVVAGLSLAVPSLFYAGTLMTENAFYPVFLLVVLLLVLVLERPSLVRVAALLAAVAVAFLTRAQALVFLPVLATAPVVLAVLARDARELRRFAPLYGTLAAAAAAAAGIAAALAGGPLALLGAYRSITGRSYDPVEVARWLLYHVAEIDLYVGVVPFAAFLLLLLRAGRLNRREQILLAATVSVAAWLLLQVSAFATLPFVLRIEERNVFYVAPLFFTALALWISRGAPRPLVPTAFAVATAVALPGLIPYPRLVGVSATSDTLALLPLWWLHETAAIPLERMWLAVVLAAAAAGVLLAFVPRRAALVLPAFVLVLYGLAAPPIDARTRDAAIGHLWQGIRVPERDWIDERVGRDARVAVLWTGVVDHLVVFENEFFNRSVREVYHLRDPLPGGLPQTSVTIDESDGLLRTTGGRTIGAPYLFTEDYLPIDGTIVAEDELRGTRVYRLDGPARVQSVVEGVYGDQWTEKTFVYRGFDCTERALIATFGSDSNLFRNRTQTISAEVGGRIVARRRLRADEPKTTMRVPLERDSGRCIVRFRVSPTAVPARVRQGSDDVRELGVRVLSFERR